MTDVITFYIISITTDSPWLFALPLPVRFNHMLLSTAFTQLKDRPCGLLFFYPDYIWLCLMISWTLWIPRILRTNRIYVLHWSLYIMYTRWRRYWKISPAAAQRSRCFRLNYFVKYTRVRNVWPQTIYRVTCTSSGHFSVRPVSVKR